MLQNVTECYTPPGGSTPQRAIAGSLAITFADEPLLLLPDRALFRPVHNALIVADVHLGKDAAFRHAGIPVPPGNTAKDLARLTRLLELTNAGELVVLGDLVHAKTSLNPETLDQVLAWRSACPTVNVLVIRGNHDRRAGLDFPPEARFTIVDEPHLPPHPTRNIQHPTPSLTYSHYPRENVGPHLCGHLHPVVALQDFDGSWVSAPCFHAEGNTLTLPAFGSFTGGHKVRPTETSQVYLATAKSVVRVPAK